MQTPGGESGEADDLGIEARVQADGARGLGRIRIQIDGFAVAEQAEQAACLMRGAEGHADDDGAVRGGRRGCIEAFDEHLAPDPILDGDDIDGEGRPRFCQGCEGVVDASAGVVAVADEEDATGGVRRDQGRGGAKGVGEG